jgi:FemAB-related protein (PEP-CTERM system-associated)
MSVTVSVLDRGGEPAWDAFVREAPGGTFFHLAGWRDVLERAFGHRTFYLAARRGSDISAVLPLTRIKSLLFGNSLISNAFCIHGGVVGDDAEAGEALRAEAVRLARSQGIDRIEFRSASEAGQRWQNRSGLYFIFRRELAPNMEANLKALPHTRRRMIRVAGDHGLTPDVDASVDRLHHIYADSVRQLGTPVFPKRYFQLLQEKFGDSCMTVTVVHNQTAIASVMSFFFRDEVMTYYGGGLREARAVAGNDFMYWEVMRRACERGVRVFDFGRSKVGTGAYSYKGNWGFKPGPLTYSYLQLDGREVPEINPLNPKYSRAIELWRRLPLPVTKAIGPYIVRSIG